MARVNEFRMVNYTNCLRTFVRLINRAAFMNISGIGTTDNKHYSVVVGNELFCLLRYDDNILIKQYDISVKNTIDAIDNTVYDMDYVPLEEFDYYNNSEEVEDYYNIVEYVILRGSDTISKVFPDMVHAIIGEASYTKYYVIKFDNEEKQLAIFVELDRNNKAEAIKTYLLDGDNYFNIPNKDFIAKLDLLYELGYPRDFDYKWYDIPTLRF